MSSTNLELVFRSLRNRHALLLAAAFAALIALRAFAHDGPFPHGFQKTPIYSGFYLPTAVRFAPDGHVFLIEKYGKLFAFDGLNDSTATVVKDFESELWPYHDHGMLGLAVDPQWPTRPYVYVLYALRGSPGGRISRIEIDPDTDQMVGNEVVLVEGWCLIYPSHGIGDLEFGPDGALYASGGDAASFNFVDWGQDEPYNADDSPLGPCTCSDPLMEGGALRSQDLRTSGDPAGYNGTIIRIDPDTGAALADNPLYGGDTSDDRIVAYGLRNPFRFCFDKLTGAIYVGDVGWNTWEEVNYIPNPLATPIRNFGWPCYEGPNIMEAYYYSDIPICNDLVAEGSATPPLYAYQHVNGASVTGTVIYEGGSYPAQYVGALFFADYSEHKIRVMYPDVNGVADPATVEEFANAEVSPVDLQLGPGGDIFYIDIELGSLRRIEYVGGEPPTAVAQSDVTSGPSPLTVQFSGLSSTDPNNQVLTYAWDFNNDGDYSDSTDPEPAFTFQSSGNYPVNLRVTNEDLLSDIDTIVIAVDNGPPAPTITLPDPSYQWRVGDIFSFSGSATDPDTGPMDPSTLTWDLILNHCVSLNPPNCHEHHLDTKTGVDSGTFHAVDHEYPCSLEVILSATEPGVEGLTGTDTITLYPEVATLTVASNPTGRTVGIYAETGPSPIQKQAVVAGSTGLIAQTPQIVGDTKYKFVSWSDGGAATHSITIPDTDTTYTATFSKNERPVLGAIGNKSGDEGSTILFSVTATDPDGTTPAISGTNLPTGATLTDHGDGTATFSWTPNYTQAGSHPTINFRAVDSADSQWYDAEAITITVNDFNPAPVLAAIGDRAVDENASLQFTVSASDPDGSTPTLSADNVPIGASFTDNGNGTGSFSWTPTYAQSGTYANVTFTATDSVIAQSDSESVTITVNNVNRKPQLTAIANQTVNENEVLQVDVSASDPDGTVPLLSATNAPAGAVFTDNHDGTGTFIWATGFFDAGSYPGITIVATDAEDSGLTDQDAFKITVNNINRKPIIQPVNDVSANEGETVSFAVLATDLDLTTPAIGATGLPQGATFTDRGDGTATFEWNVDYKASNDSPYTVEFTASDGDESASALCTITVANVNLPVTLDPIGNQSAVEGQTLMFTVRGSDPDGAPEYRVTDLPPGASFVEAVFGGYSCTWTPDFHASETSPYSVTFTVTDGEFEDSETIQIAVADAEAPGTITVIKPSDGSGQARKGKQKTKIKWQSSGDVGTKVGIELWRNGGFIMTVKSGTNNDGAFGWDIPNKMPTGDGYVIRVISKKNPLIYGDSGSFTILNAKKNG